MKNRINTILSKLIIFLQIFLIFNYSIDVPDPMGDSFKEDLSVNDIESITELVLEYGFGLENFVPEHDDDDPDEKSGFAKKIDFPLPKTIILQPHFSLYQNYCEHHYHYLIHAPNYILVKELSEPPEA